MERKIKLLRIVVIVLSVLVMSLFGFIIYDKCSDDDIAEPTTEITPPTGEEGEESINKEDITESTAIEMIDTIEEVTETVTEEVITEETEKETVSESTQKETLSQEELKKIEEYINKTENNPFILINYSRPEELLLTKDNRWIFGYGINASDFSENATESQVNIIWEGDPAWVPTRVASCKDIQTFIKEKTNYEMPINEIKLAFENSLVKELNLYVFTISDSMYFSYDIIEGYRINNEIYITLGNNIEVVLISENDNYYFFSCNNTMYQVED